MEPNLSENTTKGSGEEIITYIGEHRIQFKTLDEALSVCRSISTLPIGDETYYVYSIYDPTEQNEALVRRYRTYSREAIDNECLRMAPLWYIETKCQDDQQISKHRIAIPSLLLLESENGTNWRDPVSSVTYSFLLTESLRTSIHTKHLRITIDAVRNYYLVDSLLKNRLFIAPLPFVLVEIKTLTQQEEDIICSMINGWNGLEQNWQSIFVKQMVHSFIHTRGGSYH